VSWHRKKEWAEANAYLGIFGFEPRVGVGVWVAELRSLGRFQVTKYEGIDPAATRPWTLECWLEPMYGDYGSCTDLYYVKATGSDYTAFTGLLGALGVKPIKERTRANERAKRWR